MRTRLFVLFHPMKAAREQLAVWKKVLRILKAAATGAVREREREGNFLIFSLSMITPPMMNIILYECMCARKTGEKSNKKKYLLKFHRKV